VVIDVDVDAVSGHLMIFRAIDTAALSVTIRAARTRLA